MQTFTFSSNRKKPIFGDVSRSAEVNRWLRKTLSAQFGGESLLNPLASEFEVEGERVSFLIDATHEAQFIEVGTLGDINPERVRKLRYAFRDWRKEALSAILGSQAHTEIGLTEADVEQYLAPENATLLLADEESEALVWRCCLGFDFQNHSDNFLPDEAGQYVMKQNELPTMSGDSNERDAVSELETGADEGQIMNSTASIRSFPSFSKEVAVIFGAGFLLASIVAFIFSGMRPCDLTDVERQILELQTQVDQRCNDGR